MIIPAKWYNGGRGLDDFREGMLNDTAMKHLTDFPDSQVCFPGVDIAGGICYFLREKEFVGQCLVKTFENGSFSETHRPLNEFETFIRSSKAIPIINKVRNINQYGYFDSIVSSQKPFGLRTYVKPTGKGDITLRFNGGKGRIEREEVTTNIEWIDKWKVIMSYLTYDHAGRADKDGKRRIFSTMEVLSPKEVCTETYIVIGVYDSKFEVDSLAKYLKTQFVRFMVAQVTSTQHIAKANFCYVPNQNFNDSSDIDWSKSISEIDQQLYKKYDLNIDEIQYIESMIKSMDQ